MTKITILVLFKLKKKRTSKIILNTVETVLGSHLDGGVNRLQTRGSSEKQWQ